MTAKDLIPLNQRTKEEALVIQRKGGQASTPKKRLAATLRELKKKGLTKESAKRLYDIITSKEIGILYGLTYLEAYRRDAVTLNDKNMINKTYIELMKLMHGKTGNEVNVNVDNRTQVFNYNELKGIIDEIKEERK